MVIRSDALSKRDAYHLLSSMIVPRPIALVTTLSPGGVVNAAPFSFFNALCSDPPMVMLSIDRRRGERKDTARNILERREFVVNVVSEKIAESMNLCSGEYPIEVSEILLAGLSTAPCEGVSVPRIAESLAALECSLEQHVTIGRAPNDLFLGAVHCFHVADEIIDSGRVNARALKAVGRLSGSEYCTSTEIFTMERPKIVPGA